MSDLPPGVVEHTPVQRGVDELRGPMPGEAWILAIKDEDRVRSRRLLPLVAIVLSRSAQVLRVVHAQPAGEECVRMVHLERLDYAFSIRLTEPLVESYETDTPPIEKRILGATTALAPILEEVGIDPEQIVGVTNPKPLGGEARPRGGLRQRSSRVNHRVNHLRDNAYRKPSDYAQTMTTQELRDTLLKTDGQILACGDLWEIKAKQTGAGVHRVTLEKWKPR